jgi:hypothetical protein
MGYGLRPDEVVLIVNVEAQRVLEISQSPWRMIRLAVVGVALTALSASIAFRLLPNLQPDLFQQFIGYVGIVFFGLCTGILVWRLLTVRGAVVTITPEGIRDTRIAPELIPWSAITGVSTWQHRGQKVLVLAVDSAVQNRLTLTRIARWSRETNRAFGIYGLCIAATGLNINYDALLQTCLRYVKNARFAGQ